MLHFEPFPSYFPDLQATFVKYIHYTIIISSIQLNRCTLHNNFRFWRLRLKIGVLGPKAWPRSRCQNWKISASRFQVQASASRSQTSASRSQASASWFQASASDSLASLTSLPVTHGQLGYTVVYILPRVIVIFPEGVAWGKYDHSRRICTNTLDTNSVGISLLTRNSNQNTS